MNKAVLFGLAAAAGIGTALMVFQGDDSTTEVATPPAGVGAAPPPTKLTFDPNSKRREKPTAASSAPPPGSAKDTEFVRATMARQASALNEHANSAAMLWQGLAKDVSAESPDLAARCRAMSTELREQTRNPEADIDGIVKKERELLEELRRAEGVNAEALTKLAAQVDKLESAPRGPIESGNTPTAP